MTNTSTDSNLPQKLADEFSRIIRDSLSLDEMAEILRRNRTSVAGVCATHDFRDANFYMAEAFTIITGREPESDSDADAALWSAAWAIAKNAEFPRKMELVQNVEGVSVYAFAIEDMWISLPHRSEYTRFPADPIATYRLRPEEASALKHANSFLIAERAKVAERHTTRTESEISTVLETTLEGATTMAEIRRLYPNLIVWHTGDGRHALRHDDDCGGYLFITECDNAQVPKDDANTVDVGRYASWGELVEERGGVPVTELEAWIDDTLGRAITPKTVDDYFANKLGSSIDAAVPLTRTHRVAVSEPRTPHFVKCTDCHWRWIGIVLPLSWNETAKVMRNLCCPYCASKRIAGDKPAGIPPALPGRSYPECHFDNIDAGFFSADTFHDHAQLARAEWYMARWQLEARNVREMQAQSEDSD